MDNKKDATTKDPLIVTMLEIYVWPDGSWVQKEDYCENEYRYKGDDFFSLFVGEGLEDEEIYRLVSEVL